MSHDDDEKPDPFEDKDAAELRQLRRLKKRELDIAEKQLQARDGPQFISFPMMALQLLPAVEAAHPAWNPEEIAVRACDLIVAYSKEVTKRWGVPPPEPSTTGGVWGQS